MTLYDMMLANPRRQRPADIIPIVALLAWTFEHQAKAGHDHVKFKVMPKGVFFLVSKEL